MASSGPGGMGNCPVYGKGGHQYDRRDGNYLYCACGDKVFVTPPDPK